MKKILLSSMVAVLIFTGCNEEKKEEIKSEPKVTMTESNKNIEIIKEKSNEILNSSKEIAKAVKEETLKAVDNSKEMTKEVVEKAKEVSVDVVKQANSVAKDITKSIDNVIESKNDNAKSLFLKCAGCHGQNGEIHALGKSQKINEWDEAKIENALLGYKNGTYGGNMKGVMKGQVMNLSEADIKSLSAYISKMGK